MDKAHKGAWCGANRVYLHELATWGLAATQALAEREEVLARPQATKEGRGFGDARRRQPTLVYLISWLPLLRTAYRLHSDTI